MYKKIYYIVLFGKICYIILCIGSMPEWLKGADCKSAAYRYVGSNPTRPIINIIYKPTILFKIKYNITKNNKRNINKKIRDWGFLNKFRKGVKITSNNPIKLLMKNRGYRRIFVQKSFIIIFLSLYCNHYTYNNI